LKIDTFKDTISSGILGYKTKDGKIEITKVAKVDGEGKLIISRGKRRLGYDLKIKLHYKGIEDLDGGRGSIKFEEFLDDGDYQHEISAKGETNKDQCRESVRSSIQEIAQAIYDTINKLKE